MQRLKFVVTLLFLVSAISSAQKKEITLEEIWDDKFATEDLDELYSMKNGSQYSVLNLNQFSQTTTVDIYDYETLKKVKTVVNSADFPEIPLFEDYTFSTDETKVLLSTEEEDIYRRSKLGNYYVYDLKNGQITKIAEEKIQEPTFSPNGTMVAFAVNNNIFIKDLESGITSQVTFDGEKNKIINGLTDWVYEEEFSFVRAFEWNSDGTKIAFIRFDEEEVQEFSMDVYGQALYQTQEVFKYPKAGEKNAEVSLHVYDLKTNKTHDINLNDRYTDFYIPRIKWTNDSHVLSAQFMNRHQNKLDLWMINVDENTSNQVLSELDKAYIDVTFDLTFLKDNSFIWTSEKDGYNHIYHYAFDGKLINQVTFGKWEVTKYYGYNETADRIYYQSVENGSMNRDVYAVGIDGKNKERLTENNGTNNAKFSADFTYFINTFSSATTPPEYTLNMASDGKFMKSIKDNDVLAQKLSNYKTSKKEYSTITINGNDLNMWMVKPSNFDPDKEYPLLMYQYSGPGSQQVANRWNGTNDYWHQMLAQKGYVVACVDGRGTGYKGAEFKKVTYLNLVKYETEDQIAAAKKLSELPFIDADRIGIWGWSYGGHMSTNCLLTGDHLAFL
jgi:dipeptidyl-peptidase-4